MSKNQLIINPEADHLHEMLNYWEALSTIPVDLDGRIALPFAQFEVGTPRVDIFELFTDYNADIFDEGAAEQGDFRTQFDKYKSRMEIAIDLDPRQQVEENFNGGGESDSFDDLEDIQRDEVLFALDEINSSFKRGNSSGSDRREFGETEYRFDHKVVNDCSTASGLKSDILDKLEEVRKLVQKHVTRMPDDCKRSGLLEGLGSVMDAVRDLKDYDVKTDRKTPVLIDVGITCAPEDLHPDDTAIKGRYLINIPSNFTPEQMASIALDTFHTQFGISQLDDFTFTVIDGSRGVEIGEEEDAEPYQWEYLGLTVDYIGEAPEYADEDEDALSAGHQSSSDLTP